MSQLGDGTVTFTITAFPRPATRPAKQNRPGRTARHQITGRQLRPGQLTAPPLIAAPVLLTPAELPTVLRRYLKPRTRLSMAGSGPAPIPRAAVNAPFTTSS